MIFVLATQVSYGVNMANTARIAIDDYHHDLGLDWFRAMVYSFYESAENKLRKLIALPGRLTRHGCADAQYNYANRSKWHALPGRGMARTLLG